MTVYLLIRVQEYKYTNITTESVESVFNSMTKAKEALLEKPDDRQYEVRAYKVL